MSLVVFILVVLVALGFFANTLYGRFRLLQAATPINRFDRVGDRIKELLVYGFGQKKFVTGEQPAGWMHIVIFWGFVILGLHLLPISLEWRFVPIPVQIFRNGSALRL